ncbi:hypothetical protein BU25DRAFT_298436, partial [Macroventuria anomochaeta]
IPPNFDSAAYTHLKTTKSIEIKVTFVSPFCMMLCLGYGHFVARGTKSHDACKKTASEEYLGIKAFWLHTRCPNCREQITIETPQSPDCEVNEKADQRLHRLESETSEEVDDSGIETLESKQEDAMKEMAVADALGEILAANAGREGMQV